MSSIETIFNQARQRVLAGEHLSLEEQAELVKLLRGERFGAAEASAGAQTKRAATRKAKTGPSDEDLDKDFSDLGL